jgi:hypothetical protein
MNERNREGQEKSIAPRLRKNEVLPEPQKGMEITRLYGELVEVPARQEGEPYVGESPYTERQLRVLAEMAQEKHRRAKLSQSGDIFLA